MILDKMAAICPDFKWLGFQIPFKIQTPWTQPLLEHSKSRLVWISDPNFSLQRSCFLVTTVSSTFAADFFFFEWLALFFFVGDEIDDVDDVERLFVAFGVETGAALLTLATLIALGVIIPELSLASSGACFLVNHDSRGSQVFWENKKRDYWQFQNGNNSTTK